MEEEVSAAIFFGTAEFSRYAAFSNPSFRASRAAVDEALRRALKLPALNVLDLFGATDSVSSQFDRMGRHLRDTRKQHEGRVINLFVYYVGHGYLSPPNDSFYLAHADYEPTKRGFGFSCAEIGRLIKNEASDFRVFYVLDCCFSGQAAKELMGDELIKLAAQSFGVEKEGRKSATPRSGSALLCAATADRVARAPRNSNLTVFSGALVDALSDGSSAHAPHLHLGEVCDLAWASIQRKFARKPAYQIRPISMPLIQSEGDISKIRLFPNAWRDNPRKVSAAGISLAAGSSASPRPSADYRPAATDRAVSPTPPRPVPTAVTNYGASMTFKSLMEDIESALTLDGVFNTEAVDFAARIHPFESNAIANQSYLLRLFIQKLLFASTKIHSCAFGSSNAWVCHRDCEEGGKHFPVSLRSGEREGLFDIDQLVTRSDNSVYYRTNPVSYMPSQRRGLSVAAGAIVEGAYVFEPLVTAKYDSRAEKRMGITHILGFPLFKPAQIVGSLVGVPLVITVDFSFAREPNISDRQKITEACARMESAFNTFNSLWKGPKSFTAPRKQPVAN